MVRRTLRRLFYRLVPHEPEPDIQSMTPSYVCWLKPPGQEAFEIRVQALNAICTQAGKAHVSFAVNSPVSDAEIENHQLIIWDMRNNGGISIKLRGIASSSMQGDGKHMRYEYDLVGEVMSQKDEQG